MQAADCCPTLEKSGREGSLKPDITRENSVRRCTSNLEYVNILPAKGANVIDILRHKYLIITDQGLRDLTDRLTRPLNRGFKPLGYDWKALKKTQAEQAEEERRRRAVLAAWLKDRSPAAPTINPDT
jgi:hypothetical protein